METPSLKRKLWLGRVVRWTATALGMAVLCLASMLAWLWRASEPVVFDDAAAAGITHTAWRQIVPGPAVPEGLTVMASNNNVDAVRFQGLHFMAFRTAPTHFASSRTRMVVLRSSDLKTWALETVFDLDQSDLREPRFLDFKGKLFLYFFRGGSNPLGFEPHSIYMKQRTVEGGWTDAHPIFEPGYVVWRAKVHGDTAYMSVYHGAGLYTTAERSGEVRLLTSKDGEHWAPLSKEPQCTVMSAEEGEFEFDEEGNLVATIRLEVQGALVCRASKDNLAHWETHYTAEKYDSALMFRRGEAFYVIARRNVAGAFHRGVDWLPASLQRGWNLARYSLTRKRMSLYQIELATNTLKPLFDFPSKGDTAFPALVPLDQSTYYLVNYSCALDGPDWPWLGGQIAGTQLYDTVLTFPPA